MLVEAVGGAAALSSLPTFQLKASGNALIEYESLTPSDSVQASIYERVYTFASSSNFRVSALWTPLFESFVFLPSPIPISRVVDGMSGVTIGGGAFIGPGPTLSSIVGSLTQQQLLFNPHFLLQAALLSPDLVLSTDNPIKVQNDVSTIHLYIDEDTGFVKKLMTKYSHPLVRDTPYTIEFFDWDLSTSSGVVFPSSIKVLSASDEVIWEEKRMAITENPKVDDGYLTVPPQTMVDEAFYEFGKQSHQFQESIFEAGFAFNYAPGYQPGQLIANGVYFLGSGANSLAIQHSSGVVIVEATASEAHARDLLANVEALFPGQPVTHLIQSHHHVDHAAGCREVVGTTGATLVVGHGVADFWANVFQAESSLRPDAMVSTRLEHEIVEIGLSSSFVVVNEPGMVVAAYHTTLDPHAEDHTLVVIDTTEGRLVYEADIYNAGVGVTVVSDGPEALFEALKEIGVIDENCSSDVPLSIVPAHGFVQTLEQSLTELATLGVDVGCP